MYRINYFSSFKNIHQIWQHEDGNYLYLGDYSAALDVKMLQTKNITTVVTAAMGLPLDYSKLPINHKIYNALDVPNYNISKHFADAIDTIQKGLKQGNVFVHCAAGISRSTSIVCAYLMSKNKWTFLKTLGFVRAKRRIVCPNPGFERQLKNFEKQIQMNETQTNQSNVLEKEVVKTPAKQQTMTKTMSIPKKPIQEEPSMNKTQTKRMSLQPAKRSPQTNFNLRIVNIRR